MSNSSTPEKEKEEATMIDPGIGKEISKIKFASDQVDEQPVYHNLSFYRFVEGFGDFVISNLRPIDVILSTECIFAEVSKLWFCFESFLNLISSWNVKLKSFCKKEAIMKNVESISLINTNYGTDSYEILSNFFYGTKFESSIDRKQYFCLSAFLNEVEGIFGLRNRVSENFFVLEETGSLDLEIFWWSEIDNGNDDIINDIDEIRRVLKLSGGSRTEDFSSFSKAKFSDFVTIDDSVEIIGALDFYGLQSLKEVRFSSGNHLRKIDGFIACRSLCRIEIPLSVEKIGSEGFCGCTSLNEIVFSSGTHLREIRGFSACRSLCRIEVPSSVEKIGVNGFFDCTSLSEIVFSSQSHLREIDGFRQCKSLCRIEIPSSVEKIGWSAFNVCTSL
jgi:hypothetical protein